MVSDEILMARYAAGSVAAFEALLERYRRRVYGYFLRLFRDPGLAEDLYQSTFIRLHDHRQRFDPSRSFAPWLFTIAANLGRDEQKRRRRRPADRPSDAESAAWPSSGPDPERQVLQREEIDLLGRALDRLTVEQREVLLLRNVEGLSFPEIAAMLGENLEAVKARTLRALAALRREMRKEDLS